LKEVLGLKYGLSTSKLFFQKHTLKATPVESKDDHRRRISAPMMSKDEEERIFVEEDRTFFCSELIAKAYKVLGVIEDD